MQSIQLYGRLLLYTIRRQSLPLVLQPVAGMKYVDLHDLRIVTCTTFPLESYDYRTYANENSWSNLAQEINSGNFVGRSNLAQVSTNWVTPI